MLYSLSRLDDIQIGHIRSLEDQLGKRVLSFTRHDIQAAGLNQEEPGKLRDLENKLGVALVAIQWCRTRPGKVWSRPDRAPPKR
jgi:hypothetical protein